MIGSSLLAALRDARRRRKTIVWAAMVAYIAAAFVVLVAAIGTSTRLFCAESCHHVQDDTIASYKASAHSQISCIACHEPVNGTPVQFALAKMKSAGELPLAITGSFTFPLNKGSAAALNPEEMGDKQCTQCHGTNRKITPDAGIKIDHAIHTKNGVTCTTCHNRVAHDESTIQLKLAGNVKHADFMKMDACFRCHGLEGRHDAPGTCPTCHPAKFDLIPSSHRAADWLPAGHSEAAAESLKEFGRAIAEAKSLVDEGIPERGTRAVEHCSTCHKRAFCKDCHAKLAAQLKTTKR